MNFKGNLLVVGAHADDDFLGAGGTMSRFTREGGNVLSVTFCRELYGNKNVSKKIKESISVLGKNAQCVIHNAPDRRFVDTGYFTDKIESAIKSFRPDYIITHGHDDLNTDHSVVCNAVLIASRLPQRHIGYNKRITAVLHMEVPSSTDWGNGFFPNFFVGLEEVDIITKIEALKKYKGVLRDFPHPRSEINIFAQAETRGSMCGIKYAEGFKLGWFII